ncbi:MAG: AEC family transporter [Capsulimonadaceae bacterium]|nr:AEC family transporter [Capsulimonadaceae bacterium]
MTVLQTVLIGLAPLFLLIVVGNLLRREATTLHISHVPIINGLVINVTLPAMIFLALLKAPPMSRSALEMPLLLIGAEAITMLAAYGIGRAFHFPKSSLGMMLMAGTFGNTAFLGYPIARSLLPNMFPTAVMLDEFGMMVVMYVAGAFVMGAFGHPDHGGGSPKVAIMAFLRGRLFLSIVAAMVARNIQCPPILTTPPFLLAGGMIMTSLAYLAQGTTPLILLAVGASLRPKAALSRPKSIILPSVLKLIFCPAAFLGFCHVAGVHGDMLRIGALQAAMPTGVLASVLCERSKMDGSAAVGTVFATTILSAITIPILMLLLR